MRKGIVVAVISGVLAFGVAVTALVCLERVPVGYVGVIYSAAGAASSAAAGSPPFSAICLRTTARPVMGASMVPRT